MYELADALKSKGHEIDSIGAEWIPLEEYQVPPPVDEQQSAELEKLMDRLDEIDEIVKIHHNIIEV
jgi:transcriptional/translational regulatory protein YebC/TACO1